MGLGQVHGRVDQVDGALPGQGLALGQQRKGGKADRRRDGNLLAAQRHRLGPDDRQQALRQGLHFVGGQRAHHDQEFLAAPAHGQVLFAQGRLQSAGDFDQDFVPRGMTVLIVDALEVVDVDQHHRPVKSATVHGRLLHHRQQVTSVGQAGQRVALARHLEQGVAVFELLVAASHAAQQQGHQHQQKQASQDAGHPQALLQVASLQLGLLEFALGLKRGEFALAAFGVKAFLQLQHRLLVLALEHIVGHAAVLGQGLPSLTQQTCSFQRMAQFFLNDQHLGQRARFLLDDQGLANQGLALGVPTQAYQGQARVGQCQRLAGLVLDLSRQGQGLLGQAKGGLVVAALQVVVGQIGRGQHLLALGTGLARQVQRSLCRAQFFGSMAQLCLHDEFDGHRRTAGQQVLRLVGQLDAFAVDGQRPVQLFGQHQRIGQGAAQV